MNMPGIDYTKIEKVKHAQKLKKIKQERKRRLLQSKVNMSVALQAKETLDQFSPLFSQNTSLDVSDLKLIRSRNPGFSIMSPDEKNSQIYLAQNSIHEDQIQHLLQSNTIA